MAACKPSSLRACTIQQIEWYECGEDEGLDDYTAEALDAAGFDLDQIGCAYVLAPLDWDDQRMKNISSFRSCIFPLPVMAILGTLLGNPGGPVRRESTLCSAWRSGFEKITASYDLLRFGRGVLGHRRRSNAMILPLNTLCCSSDGVSLKTRWPTPWALRRLRRHGVAACSDRRRKAELTRLLLWHDARSERFALSRACWADGARQHAENAEWASPTRV